MYLNLCIYVSIYLSLSIYLPIYLSIDLSIYVSIYLPIYLSIYLSIHLCISVSCGALFYLSQNKGRAHAKPLDLYTAHEGLYNVIYGMYMSSLLLS